jgi:hypothetical protein
LSYSWRNGSVTAVTPPDFEIFEYSQALAADPVFDPNGVAYRVDAATSTVTINWSHSFRRTAALNLGYTYRTSKPDNAEESYYSNIVSLSVSYSL